MTEELNQLQDYITMRMNSLQELRKQYKDMDDECRGRLNELETMAQILDEKRKGEK